jgi:hypothetical protein
VRHVIALLLGIVLAPTLLVGLGWSSSRLYHIFSLASSSWNDELMPVGIILVCALIYAVIIGSRISPLAGFVSGAPFLTLQVLVLIPSSLNFLRSLNLPESIGLLPLGFTGTPLVIGALGVIPVVIPSRWAAKRSRKASTNGPSSDFADLAAWSDDPFERTDADVPHQRTAGSGKDVNSDISARTSPDTPEQTLRAPRHRS